MKKLTFLALVLISFFMSACEATQTTDTGVIINTEVDPNLYTVVLTLDEPVEGYTQTNAQFTSINGYARGVVWQDGKGIVRGTLYSVDPEVDFVAEGDTTVVKTTDWKVTGLLPGDTVTLQCIADYEPVCAKSTTSGRPGECIEMWEFDFCRLDSIEPLEVGR